MKNIKLAFKNSNEFNWSTIICGELKCYDFDQNTNRFTIIGSLKTLSFVFKPYKFNVLGNLHLYLNGKYKTREFALNQNWEESDIKITYSTEQIKSILEYLKEAYVLPEEITLGEEEQKLVNGEIDTVEKTNLDIKIHYEMVLSFKEFHEAQMNEKDKKLVKELQKFREEINRKIKELGGE